MSSFSIVILALSIPTNVFGTYSLVDEYKGVSFFNGFDLVNWNGQTTYSNFVMNYSAAYEMGLINTTSTTVYIGTDYKNKVTNKNGRYAIEIASKKGYTQGLFIVDLTHMPYGCAVWPAFWLNGPNWPNGGEIDIIEQINLSIDDQSTLHTGANCMYDAQERVIASADMTGSFVSWQNGNCSYQPGCSVVPNNVNTFGHQFNSNGGGVFATILDDSKGIQIWFWTHDKVPSDITNKKPIPSTWGKPYANWPFGSFCTSNHFHDLQIIFDLYYCGWAGEDSTWKSQCQNGGPANGQTCEQFVANNPSYFKNAYWLINYVVVYQQ